MDARTAICEIASMRRTLLLIGLFPSLALASGWNGRILDGHTREELDLSGLSVRLQGVRNIVLGEKHYTGPVQAAEAAVIRSVVSMTGAQFATAWEFLNVKDGVETAAAFSDFRLGKIDAEGFLIRVHGPKAGVQDASYIPILEVVKDLGGDFYGVNLSREEKAPIVHGGITAADPSLVPPGFEMGGPLYLERFTLAMTGGHSSPEEIQNYFAAQCLTDDVMAHELLKIDAPIRFLVAGSFHSDYRDAAVRRIEARSEGDLTRSVRIIDASDFTADELELFLHDERYGDLADFAYFVNEPVR